MAMTEADIKVVIAAELQKAGFVKAEKATKDLTKSFQKLGAAIGVALSARAFINFAKQGAMAFAAEEKAVKQLTNSLANLGFAFSVPGVERYLESMEKATLVTKEELRPAIVNLISTTMSAKKGMELLSIAVDASAKTGQDLGSVTNAITRAYRGSYTALAKLTRGYTSAELEAGGFKSAIEILSAQVSGSASAATDTYSFKIGQLQKAVGDAQKAVGEGLIKAIEQLGSGDYDEGLQDLVDFGDAIGKSFGYAAGAVDTLVKAYNFLTLRAARDITSDLLGKTEAPRGGTITPTQFELAKAAVEKRKEKAIRAKELADRKKLAALEAAERKKREAALRKEQALKRAGTVFDLENIQIVAAMQNKISENERLRLTALLALNTGNADAAEKLSTAVLAANAAALAGLGVMMKSGDSISDVIKKLIEAQGKAAILGMNIGAIPKAPNPFEAWPSIIAGLLSQIGTLNTAINNLGKGTPSIGGTTGGTTNNGSTTGKNGNSGVGGSTVTVPSAIIPPVGVNPDTSLGGGFNIGANQYPNSSYFAGIAATSPYMPSSYFAGLAAVEEAKRDAEIRKASGAYMSSSYFAGLAASQPTIVVNVQGSVVAAEDLAETITDIQYNFQKTGKGLLYSSTAI